MAKIFEVTYKDIEELNADQLTLLLKRLLSLEAASNHIPQSTITCNLQINASDDGEDASISWVAGSEKTNWFPSRNVLFQCKATDICPSKCKTEVLVADGSSVKILVDEVLSAGGSYIIFCRTKYGKKMIRSRVAAIRESLTNIGKQYAKTADIDIYDANKIATWTNHYVSAIVEVRSFKGAKLPATIKTWAAWQGYSFHQQTYHEDETLKKHIVSLRIHLSKPQSVARIIGLSGVGKTRLALEVFRSPANISADSAQFALSANCVYINTESTANIVDLVADWVSEKLEGIIVVDNCDRSLHSKLRREVTHVDSKLSLVTLDYSLDDCNEDYSITLEKLDDRLIAAILRRTYPGFTETDVSHIVKFAQGNPQMAILIADAYKGHEPDIANLKEPEMIEHLLWQRQPYDANALKTIEACSLFTHLGYTEDVACQRIFVAEQICNMNRDDFYRHAQKFVSRKVINPQGRYIHVVPFPLAITLAAQWWAGCSAEQAEELFCDKLPPDLLQPLCDQLAFLQFVPRAREIATTLTGDKGPFGQAEVLLSAQGSRLFRSIVEINPEPCLQALQNAIGALPRERLLEIGPARRNIVWSLEKLCFWETTFPGAARLMLSLASAENESWGNNATHQFLQLYHICLSGTQAPPSLKFEILDEALASEEVEKKILAVRALGSALKTHYFSRVAGPDHQGSRAPQKDWIPQSKTDIYDYQDESIKRLIKVACSVSPELSQLAKKEFGQRLRGLIFECRETTLASAIRKIGESSQGYWPDAVSDLRDSLQYDSSEMTPETLANIKLWLKWLEPAGLEDRLRLIVSIPHYEHIKDANGKFRDVAEENAISLARELALQIDQIVPFLTLLMTGEQRQAYSFGKELARLVSDTKTFAMQMLESLRLVSSDNGNPALLCGFLFVQTDREAITEVLTRTDKDPQLVKYLVELTRLSNPTSVDLERVVVAVKEDRVPLARLYAFSVNSVVDHLSSDQVVAFCDNISAISLAGVACALQILYMFCFLAPDRFKACRAVFRRYILTNGLLAEVNKRLNFCGHGWQEVSKYLLTCPDKDDELSTCIAKDITYACSQEAFPYEAKYIISPILEILFEQYSAKVWPSMGDALLSDDWRTQHNFGHLMDDLGDKLKTGLLLSKVPLELLIAWCKDHAPKGAQSLARIIPVIVKDDGSETYKWHPYALAFIDAFGNDDGFLQELTGNLHTYSWSGSLVPYYQIQVVLMEALQKHRHAAVKTWAQKQISWLNPEIDKVQKREQERKCGIYSLV